MSQRQDPATASPDLSGATCYRAGPLALNKEGKMKVICDICGGEMRMSWTHKIHEDEDHIKFTCTKCGNVEYLT
jgi:ssDNA-binding Zn-finger/Zn-ribbon topoisomerase 1